MGLASMLSHATGSRSAGTRQQHSGSLEHSTSRRRWPDEGRDQDHRLPDDPGHGVDPLHRDRHRLPLDQIDDKKLRIVLGELSTALAGTGDDLGRILDQGTDLLATLAQVWPETNRVITNAGTVLRIVSDNEGNLRTLGTKAKQFAAFLRSYEPEWQRVLDRAPDREYRPGLGSLLAVIKNERLRIQLIPVRTARCDYGTTRHQPYDPERYGYQTGGACSASFDRLQRGAAHAPGPVR